MEIDGPTAELLLRFGMPYAGPTTFCRPICRPGSLELARAATPCLVVKVDFHRYAVEDKVNRLTLDVCVCTDRGKVLSTCVLEQKSNENDQPPYADFSALGLGPSKLSKFLWASMF